MTKKLGQQWCVSRQPRSCDVWWQPPASLLGRIFSMHHITLKGCADWRTRPEWYGMTQNWLARVQDPVMAGESQVLSFAEAKQHMAFPCSEWRGICQKGWPGIAPCSGKRLAWESCIHGQSTDKCVFANGEFYYAFKTKTCPYQGMLIIGKIPQNTKPQTFLELLQRHKMSSRENTSLTDIKPKKTSKAHL